MTGINDQIRILLRTRSPSSSCKMCMQTQWFLLLMTGKGSSSCPVIFYWKEITLCEGCSAVFNGLIALEKAATGNAVTRGKYHSETLSATRESQRISLMGGRGVVSDVRYFLFSIASLSIPLHPHLCPLPAASYLSQHPSSRQLHQEPYHRLPAWKIS